MINQFLIILILYLVLNQVIQYYNDTSDSKEATSVAINTSPDSAESESESESETESKQKKNKKNKKSLKKKQKVPLDLFGTPRDHKDNEYIVWVFHEPKPWSQIIYLYNQDFPFKFFIKVKIPSLNDYQSWKEVIPNLDFDAKTGELIIPSKDEASALAVANLILSTFGGQIKLETILEKGLIQISVLKAQQFDLVKNKLREQIIDNLQGKSTSIGNKDYEADLAKNNKEPSQAMEEFNSNSNEPMAAMPGEGYSYI
jgi:uncharacterized membrane protein YhiD involved in acid resistance